MQVRDGMTAMALTVGPGHTLRETAHLMSERNVGAAVVIDPDGPGLGIITERDILHSVGAGHDPDCERVGDHLTREVIFAVPDWSLEEAAAVMVHGGFRHLIVIEDGRRWASSPFATSCAAGRPTERSVPCRQAPRPDKEDEGSRVGCAGGLDAPARRTALSFDG